MIIYIYFKMSCVDNLDKRFVMNYKNCLKNESYVYVKNNYFFLILIL